MEAVFTFVCERNTGKVKLQQQLLFNSPIKIQDLNWEAIWILKGHFMNGLINWWTKSIFLYWIRLCSNNRNTWPGLTVTVELKAPVEKGCKWLFLTDLCFSWFKMDPVCPSYYAWVSFSPGPLFLLFWHQKWENDQCQTQESILVGSMDAPLVRIGYCHELWPICHPVPCMKSPN